MGVVQRDVAGCMLQHAAVVFAVKAVTSYALVVLHHCDHCRD